MPPLIHPETVVHTDAPHIPEVAGGKGEVLFMSRDKTRRFHHAKEVESVHALDEVVPALQYIQLQVDAGYTAAGYLAYEAAPAFDSAFQTHPQSDRRLPNQIAQEC